MNTIFYSRSAALACRRLRGSHTFDVLAGALEDIHSAYGIRQKVTRTTTDNGSNFVKAFSVFGVSPTTEDDQSKLELCLGGQLHACCRTFDLTLMNKYWLNMLKIIIVKSVFLYTIYDIAI